MATAAGHLAAAGALAALPPAVLWRRGAALWLSRRAPPSCGPAACSGCPSPRVAAAPPSADGGGPISSSAASLSTSTSTSTSVSMEFGPAGVRGLPWKVQWQIQGVTVAVDADSASGSALLSASATAAGELEFTPQQQQQPQQQQPQQAPQLRWTPFDRAENVRAAAFAASGWDRAGFDARYADLAAVLPDLPRVLPTLSSSQLLAAMSDPHAMAAKVVVLKAALPSTNVGMLLLMHPPFLDPACGPETLLAGLEHAMRVLGGRAVAEEVLQWYPPLLDPAVLDASVAQLRRLVPHLARSCLPSGGRGMGGGAGAGNGVQGRAPRADAPGDPRQLVHLLGIVMQSEGAGLKAAEEDGGSSMWWGCS